MQWIRSNAVLIIIILFALFSRLLFLSSVPVATTGDQLHYIIDAQSFLITGKDTSATVTPLGILSFHYPKRGMPQAELPYFLEMAVIGLFGANPISVVLPSVLLSVGTIIVLYFLGKELISKNVGLFVACITAINPWAIAIGRTGYEMAPATFFYSLALYVILKAKDKYLLLALPLMLLAFYSYIGTKLLFVPFFFASLAYSYFYVNKRKYTPYFLILVAGTMLIAGIFILMITTHTGSSRMAEIITPANPHVADAVNNLRKLSFNSPFNAFFDNKLTVYARMLILNTFTVFSPGYLFYHGDYFFSIWRHGLFYYLDGLFLLIGILGMFCKKRRLMLFLIVLLAISIIPQIFHDADGSGNFTPHISLLFPIFYLFIGYGIVFLYQNLKLKRNKVILLSGILVLYILSTLNFLNIYFNQSPMQSGVYSSPLRLMAHYVGLAAHTNNSVIILTSDPISAFTNYVFYNNLYTNVNADRLNHVFSSRDKYQFNQVTFVSCGSAFTPSQNATIIYDNICNKKLNMPSISISQLSDSGSVYAIYNDHVCSHKTTQTYISGLSITDLNVEKLSNDNFCSKLLVAY